MLRFDLICTALMVPRPADEHNPLHHNQTQPHHLNAIIYIADSPMNIAF